MYYLITGYVAYFNDKLIDNLIESFNITLIFMGLAISFSSLQDPTKVQNKFSLRIYQNPKKGKIYLFFLFFSAIAFIILGLIGIIYSNKKVFSELGTGILTLGIGYLGMLRVGIEMFENHRLDRNPD